MKWLFRLNTGFTIIELLISMAVASILLTGVYKVYESQLRSQISQDTSLELQQGLRGALSIMEGEIRSAGADPSGKAGTGILVATAGEFRFTRDITGGEDDAKDNDNDDMTDESDEYFDEDTNDANENVRYALSATSALGRGTGIAASPPLQPMLDNVVSLNFAYRDRAGDPIAAPVAAGNLNNIRQVVVTIVARSARLGRQTRMSTTITCRNMGVGI